MKLIWLLPLLKKNLEREKNQLKKRDFYEKLAYFHKKKAKIEKAVNLKKGSE